EVRVVRSPAACLPEGVQEAKRQARERLVLEPPMSERSVTAEPYAEAPILAATRRAMSKARPDKEGFVTASAAGIVPLRVGPWSLDRALRILSRFLALAKLQVYNPKATDTALVLVVDGEPVAFGIEEQPQKTYTNPHRMSSGARATMLVGAILERLGPSTSALHPSAWLSSSPKSSYSGLRRTYADGGAPPLLMPRQLKGHLRRSAASRRRRAPARGARSGQGGRSAGRRRAWPPRVSGDRGGRCGGPPRWSTATGALPVSHGP